VRYSALTLEVHLCEDPTGRVWSYHDFQTPEDEATALGLRHAGAQQVAYALLTEAYRRECFVVVLTEMSQEPGFLDRYRSGDPEAHKALETRISEAAQEVMRRTLKKMGSDVSREILEMLLSAG
jgi:hypothetical protein